jgi:hypothetical protein
VPTSAGPVQVDVLEVTDADLAPLPDDPTDRLHVLSHAWAATSATTVIMRASGTPNLTVAVAEPGPLVAMKLQSIMNRGSEKEGTDLLDITVSVWTRPPGRFFALSSLKPTRGFVPTLHATHDDGSPITPSDRFVVCEAYRRAGTRNWMISISLASF